MAKDYNEDSFDVLRGLKGVRRRPGMYIGDKGEKGHFVMFREIIDNAIDEAQNGHCDQITVTLDADKKGVTVADNGRGIPVGPHPIEKLPVIDLIFTVLHAGAKFDSESYDAAGGTHGVGSAVVNALSTITEVTSFRPVGKGKTIYKWSMSFMRGSDKTSLKKEKTDRNETGTTVHFRPDEEIFGDLKFNAAQIAEHIETKSYLHPGLKITFKNLNKETEDVYYNEDGLTSYMDILIKRNAEEEDIPRFILEDDNLTTIIAFTKSNTDSYCAFVNSIHNIDGGTHTAGVRDAFNRSIREFIDHFPSMVPKKLKLSKNDILSGTFALISLKMREPEFSSQHKDHLISEEAKDIVTSIFYPKFSSWLLQNRSVAERIIQTIVERAMLRQGKTASKSKLKRSLSKFDNLGKLSMCKSNNPEECELYIVEGDSAGGSAKDGRDNKTQAILPLKGKIINVDKNTDSRISKNEEVKSIESALMVELGGDDYSKLRFHKVIITTDADDDGYHIESLLLRLFRKKYPRLIKNGSLYIAIPPLFKVTTKGKYFGRYLFNQQDRIDLEKMASKDGISLELQRFKGLGEMDPDQLYETTMDPKNRRFIQIKPDF